MIQRDGTTKSTSGRGTHSSTVGFASRQLGEAEPAVARDVEQASRPPSRGGTARARRARAARQDAARARATAVIFSSGASRRSRRAARGPQPTERQHERCRGAAERAAPAPRDAPPLRRSSRRSQSILELPDLRRPDEALGGGAASYASIEAARHSSMIAMQRAVSRALTAASACPKNVFELDDLCQASPRVTANATARDDRR